MQLQILIQAVKKYIKGRVKAWGHGDQSDKYEAMEIPLALQSLFNTFLASINPEIMDISKGMFTFSEKNRNFVFPSLETIILNGAKSIHLA